MSVGGTSNIFTAGLMTRSDWGCAASAMFSMSSSASSSLSSGWSGSTCRGVFIPSSSSLGSSSGQALHPLKLGQAFHTGGQPSSVLRQSSVTAHGSRARMHGGHFLFSHPLLLSSDSKNVSRFLGLFGKQGTGHLHGGPDVLVGQSFLGAFVDFFLDHLLRFAFDTACQPCF